MEKGIVFDEKLTEREQTVFNLLIDGFSNEEISKKLCVSIKTVRTHVMHIYLKKGFDGHNALQKMICDYYKNILNTLQNKQQERY